MSAERYYVKRPTGKVFGPFDKNAILIMLKSNKLDADAEVSADKVAWLSLAQVPEFAPFARPSAPSSAGTMLGTGWAADASLPRRADGGGELPRPAGLDLPRSASGHPEDLPRSSAGGLSHLPRAAERPRGDDPLNDLPRASAPSLSDLPRASAPSLSDLPRASAPSDLPRASAPSDLPRASAPADLPRPQSAPPLRSGQAMSLPPLNAPASSGMRPALTPSHEEEDLFSAPARQDEDDLFGGGDDLFELSRGQMDEEDLFGAPAPAPPVRQPTPQAPAPSAAELFSGPLSSAEDDLFGAPPSASPTSHALFDEDDEAGGDDFLGGDQGFSFLDEKPRVAAGPELHVDSWGEDLLDPSAGAAPSWSDEMLVGNTNPEEARGGSLGASGAYELDLDAFEAPPLARPAPIARAPQPASAPVDDPLRPASSGMQPVSPGKAKNAQTTQAEATAQDKKRGKMVMLGAPVLAILVLGGLVFGAIKLFDKEPIEVAPVAAPMKALEVDLKQLRAASWGELRQLTTEARKAKLTPETAGKVLLAHALMLASQRDEETLKAAQALATGQAAAGIPEAALGRGALLALTGDDPGPAREILEPLADAGGELGFFAQVMLGAADARMLERLGPPASEAAPPIAPTQAVAVAPDMGDGAADMAPEAAPAASAAGLDRASVAARAQKVLTSAAREQGAMPGYWLGRVHRAQAQERDALASLDRAVAADEGYIPALVLLGRARYEQGDLNDALKHLSRVAGELAARASNVERGTTHHYIGLVYSARSQSQEAIDAFTQALSVDTGRADTLRALAEEYERAQQYEQALNFFTTNKNLGQKDPDVLLGIVRAYKGLRQWQQAITQLELGQKEFPTDARFPEQLGELNLSRGTFYEAQKALERAVEIDPKLLSAQATLAQLAWRTEKDFERGEQHVRQIVAQPELIDTKVATGVAEFYHLSGRLNTAQSWYQSAIERDPNFWPARLALSRLLLEQGQTKQALALLERSRKEGVADIRLSAYLADAYRQTKLYDRAIDEINQVIEKFPKNAEYTFIRGRIHFDRGNYETAIEDFNKAYQLDPRYHEAYFFVGRTAFVQGDKNTAMKIFRHVLDYQPGNGEFRFFMGRALEGENRQIQALEEYRKTTEVDPGYGVRNPELFIYRGRLLSKLGYSREGKKDIARALELAPELDEALIAMGEADYMDKDYDSAIKHLSKALQRDPARPKPQQLLGMSYIYTKRPAEGARHLQQALRHGSEDTDIYRTLGYLYKEMGQRAQAREAFQEFVRKTATRNIPEGTRREILRQIQELGG